MAIYTVVIDTGDAEQDEVLAELERVPSVVLVQFMGPGALVGPYDDDAPASPGTQFDLGGPSDETAGLYGVE
jgi:hypothetical protein